MFRMLVVLTLAAAATVWHPVAAAAHGVGSREADPGVARAMVFLYADGDPMAFAQVQVTGPDGAVYQSARTDGRGGFAFLPSGRGLWQVAASDGQGHRAVRNVTVELGAEKADGTGPVGARGGPSATLAAGVAGAGAAGALGTSAGIGPGWRDVALGLSLLANLALGARWWRRRASCSPY
ncbi:carboxypeptidase-like regulatory domain-containing protein [Desulfovibrio sp. TomC]|uniref:carboxypeptidase-like regulatory domain-containing protein n=1 Tax=Desulfovibrio sp. TomC TaxID=1562888 RepID=UPI0005754FDB|nr:carboxypeptidase-like regulatory domain-containing protein [Desulfovibrio sp. TomC]KHK01983.1 hypothetical protein NY78_2467 [Desulfovibrio sp. TomC]